MHAFQPTLPARRPLRSRFNAVLLLSLGWIGCDLLPGGGDDENTNHIPTIAEVTATSTSIDEGSSITLSVNANDSDGDPLTYAWTQLPAAPAGTFGNETGETRTWTAPVLASNTTFTLQVTVSDGKGGTAQSSVDVTVANVPVPNRAPTVDAAITVPATSVLAGDTVNLSIGATDVDGDVLTYSWTTSPAGEGIFTHQAAAAAQWRSSDISVARSYSIQVTVSDGTDSVTRSVDVQVNVPTYTNDIQPLWNALCTDCHNSSTSTRGGLNLDPGKSYGSIVNSGAAGAPCGPTGLKRVVPGKPDESLLVKKISPNPVCGSRMPMPPTSTPTYFDEHPGELTRIRSWILAGALNN